MWSINVAYDVEQNRVYIEHQFCGQVFAEKADGGNARSILLVEALTQDLRLAIANLGILQ